MMTVEELANALDEAPATSGVVWVEVVPGEPLRQVVEVTYGDDMDGWHTYLVLESAQQASDRTGREG